MSNFPWDDWIPGVLSDKQIKRLFDDGFITNTPEKGPDTDYSSFDLYLSNQGFELLTGSVKPFGPKYYHYLKKNNFIKKLKSDEDECYELQPKKTYLFKIKECLDFGKRNKSIYGMSTAKSSIGRTDVLVRLIVDGMDMYDSFNPEGLSEGNGDLFVEITPITFKVRVKPNEPITQLRLYYGNPNDSKIESEELFKRVLKNSNSNTNLTPYLRVDLTPVNILGKSGLIKNHKVIAYRSKSDKNNILDLWYKSEDNKPDPCNYWNIIKQNSLEDDDPPRIKIEKEAFYILRSKELINVPPGVAVYCKAMNEFFGEMRIHYAGFVHPYFGFNRENAVGTPLIFEVRGHDVNVSLGDNEPMAELIFYRMSEDVKRLESSEESDQKPSREQYNEQTLNLSGIFKKWPDKIHIDHLGNVSSKKDK